MNTISTIIGVVLASVCYVKLASCIERKRYLIEDIKRCECKLEERKPSTKDDYISEPLTGNAFIDSAVWEDSNNNQRYHLHAYIDKSKTELKNLWC